MEGSGHLPAPAAFFSGEKETEYPLNRTLDRQWRSGGFEEEKDILLLLEF